MKSVRFIVAGNQVGVDFNSQAPFALAIIQALGTAHRQNGLTVEEIIDKLAGVGIMQPGRNEKSSTSNLLQKLMQAGAVVHPSIPGGIRRYVLQASQIQLVA